jgi:hypothetical protein
VSERRDGARSVWFRTHRHEKRRVAGEGRDLRGHAPLRTASLLPPVAIAGLNLMPSFLTMYGEHLTGPTPDAYWATALPWPGSSRSCSWSYQGCATRLQILLNCVSSPYFLLTCRRVLMIYDRPATSYIHLRCCTAWHACGGDGPLGGSGRDAGGGKEIYFRSGVSVFHRGSGHRVFAMWKTVGNMVYSTRIGSGG